MRGSKAVVQSERMINHSDKAANKARSVACRGGNGEPHPIPLGFTNDRHSWPCSLDLRRSLSPLHIQIAVIAKSEHSEGVHRHCIRVPWTGSQELVPRVSEHSF